MNIATLIREAARSGVILFCKDGRLGFELTVDAFPEELRESITKNKQAIIDFLSKDAASPTSSLTPIEAVERTPIVDKTSQDRVFEIVDELSFSQQRLWFVDRFAGGSPQYNLSMSLRLSGELDDEALNHAFSNIIQRHESLRTVFVDNDENGEVQQCIQQDFDFIVKKIDLSSFSDEEQTQKIPYLVAEEEQKLFDLKRDLMLRASLLKLSDKEHILLTTMHHIASDGWSMGILVNEFSALYQAYINGKSNPLPPLPVQYIDYSIWQHRWLKGDVLDNQLDYWEKQLAGLPSVHNLPLDNPRGKTQTFSGANFGSKIAKVQTEKLNMLCEQEGATLFMGLFAVFSTFLSRFSGESDVVVGCPIANREQAEIAGLIGYFANTLVLRSDLSEQPTFVELLRSCRQTALDAYAHQQLPFEQLVEAIRPQRSMSYTPLFQVMLVLQNNQQGTLSLPGLTLSPVKQEVVHAKFDLSLTATETNQGLHLTWEYNTDLFSESSIERFASSFATLFENLLASPERKVHHVAMQSREATQDFLKHCNDSTQPYSDDLSLPRLFEQQVGRTPNALALRAGNTSLSYSQLNACANQMAHYLRSQGVSSNTLVGVCLERTEQMVVATLGIMKAGGAYVPIDPHYPDDRISHMVEDASLNIIITTREILINTPLSESKAFCLDNADDLLNMQSKNDLVDADLELQSHHLAYMIYTSGSTGLPKGVMIEHRNLVNFLEAMLPLLPSHPSSSTGETEPTRLLAVTSLSFDIHTLELYLPLISGGLCVLASAEEVSSPKALEALMATYDINIMQATPSSWQMLVDNDWQVNRPFIALCGGEALPMKLKEDLTAMPNLSLWNMYGPTETTVWSSVKCLYHGDPISIGEPIANTTFYVLDEQLQVLPLGVAGELYIGGEGVARGYFGREALTQEKFISSPFSDSERLYKTGDLVRWRVSGESEYSSQSLELEYLGRLDQQVKIRGYRIELGEIETALSGSPGVKEAVVKASKTEQPYLIAYVVGEGSQDLNAELLAAHLRQRLPDFMLPTAYVMLPELPLTLNGKVDRKALPEPDLQEAEQDYVAPHSNLEKQLCHIWQDVLEIERVGIRSNFFNLGGNSLKATKTVARVRQVLGLELELKAIFDLHVIELLALELEQSVPAVGSNCIERSPQRSKHQKVLDNGPAEEIFEVVDDLSFAQQRLWFVDQFSGGSPQYNLPVALRLSGDLNEAALDQALIAIIQRHESLRTVFVDHSEDGEPKQCVQKNADFSIKKVDLSSFSGDEQSEKVSSFVAQEEQGHFDLQKDLMLRATLLKLSEKEHILLATMHHIASDGWSMGVLISEFGRLYQAFANGEPSPLPALPVQYVDYASWQRQWLQNDVLDKQLNYWKAQLADLPSVHNLPLDRPRGKSQSFLGANHTSVIPLDETQKLNELCEQEGATLFMGLYAVFSVLLGRFSGETDVAIGCPIANRERAEIAGLIGYFSNTLVLRSDLSDSPSFIELLQSCRQTSLDAYAHQQLPFEQLVEALQPQRSMSYTPLFQVMLTLQDNQQATLDLPDLKLAPVKSEVVYSKFDLSLSVTETNRGLYLVWEYNTGLFEEASIERFAKSFGILFEKILANPEVNIHQVAMQSEEETQSFLQKSNDTARPYSEGVRLPALFEKQVSQTPDVCALIAGDTRLSYSELNQRANQLAHYLRSEGVSSDTLVGVCLPRTEHMLIATLGIMKAGGAYVPIDPSYPRDRIHYMIEDSALSIVITTSAVLDATPIAKAKTLCIDKAQDLLGSQIRDDLKSNELGLCRNDLAYMIYTSGSTGLPKGVMIEHQNLVNFLEAMTPILSSGGAEVQTEITRLLAVTSLSFDIHTLELYLPLIIGGQCVLASSEDAASPSALEELINRHDINVMQATPSSWQMLVDNGWQVSKSFIALCGGEALSMKLKEELTAMPELRLWNMYGPTETTVWSSVKRLHRGDFVSIGEPIANTTFYVLDEQLQVLPVGVAGELYIGGEGVARGYFGREALTEEKFIVSPFNDNERLYKTADLVRWRERASESGVPSNLELEYLGRCDQQVKIRGYRIELGEIETVLNECLGVKEAVVKASNGTHLVAYVVGDGSQELEAELLASDLRQRLPDFMMPATYIMLSEFPLTLNGKIDRKALPEPDFQSTEQNYIAPRTDLEKQLCEIWQEVLGLDSVGVRDNFFSLGGNSLLATKVVACIRQVTGLELDLKAIFDLQIVELLAVELEKTTPSEKSNSTKISRVNDGARLLSYGQERLWTIDKLAGGSVEYNMPVALRLEGQLNYQALTSALQTIVDRHESLRTVFCSGDNDDQPSYILQRDVSVEVPMASLDYVGEDQDKAIEAWVVGESNRPFNLSCDVMLRAKLLKISDQSHVLVVTVHHIAADGWSLGLMVTEFKALYRAYALGNDNPLEELAFQYRDYAHWQRNYLQGKEINKIYNYWKEQLHGVPELHSLPLDFARPANQSQKGAMYRSSVTGEVQQKINALCIDHGASLFMYLQSAFSILLSRYSGETDIVFGTPIANREQLDIANLIGFFANTLVLRNRLDGSQSFIELLKESKEIALDAYKHQQMPFDQLVDKLQPERSLSHSPLFQIMLVLQNNQVEELELPNLSVNPVGFESNVSKFDLTLTVVEGKNGLFFNWEYNSDLFREETIARLANSFSVLMNETVVSPEASINELPLLTSEEKVQELSAWNDTEQDFPQQCIHELIEEQVRKTPDAIAVVFSGNSMTYQELNEYANRLAHHLQSIGVTPDSMVGIYLERSFELVIAILAVLKAGGAYLPLDSSYPHERLVYFVEDANLQTVITRSDFFERAPITTEKQKLQSVFLDTPELQHALQNQSASNLKTEEQGLTPNDLAYVIYTSGSTGRPKGVMTEHRALVNRIHWMQKAFQLTSSDRVLQKTPFSFDVSVWEFIWPLAYGAQLVVALPEGHKDVNYLLRTIRENEVSTIHFVPSMLSAVVTDKSLSDCSSLKRVICSGEALSVELQNQYYSLNSAPLYNLYGPTEASIDVSYWACKPNWQGRTVPIGLPIDNTCLLILDDNLELCPMGVVGELHIGGAGLARGYWQQQALTEERFIPNPFSDDKNERLYKTGDLVRRLDCGNIEYLGRRDNQVKIRGFRVELGEIQSKMESHSGVSDSVVLLNQEQIQNEKIIAYFVPDVDSLSVQGNVESVEDWEMIFDDTYQTENEESQEELNLSGWVNSYTGDNIPRQEMLEWLDGSIEHILSFQPEKLLEIGCGTGLLLYRYSEHCKEVHGLDVSEQALKMLGQGVAARSWDHVHLYKGDALSFGNHVDTSFDTVVINSVVQYFPSLEYLREMLASLLNSMTSKGRIFIGDVRNLDLLRHHCAAFELSKLDHPDTTLKAFSERVKLTERNEKELLISPSFFTQLPQIFPQISRVDILVKKGEGKNEMLRYRYDVILHTDEEQEVLEPEWIKTDDLSLIKKYLSEKKHNHFAVAGLPNARIADHHQLVDMLDNHDADERVEALLKSMSMEVSACDSTQDDVQALLKYAQTCGYYAQATWSQAKDHALDVIFSIENNVPILAQDAYSHYPLANSPQVQLLGRKLVPELKRYLEKQLPAFMIPAEFLVIESIPLNSNGKLDRKALPNVDRPESREEYVAPISDTEKELCTIWQTVLGKDNIGIHDNFFSLGGHSLSATKVVTLMKENMGIELPLNTIFESQTIYTLSSVVDVLSDENSESLKDTDNEESFEF